MMRAKVFPCGICSACGPMALKGSPRSTNLPIHQSRTAIRNRCQRFMIAPSCPVISVWLLPSMRTLAPLSCHRRSSILSASTHTQELIRHRLHRDHPWHIQSNATGFCPERSLSGQRPFVFRCTIGVRPDIAEDAGSNSRQPAFPCIPPCSCRQPLREMPSATRHQGRSRRGKGNSLGSPTAKADAPVITGFDNKKPRRSERHRGLQVEKTLAGSQRS